MNKRIYLFDNIKYILIILVVVGHFIEGVLDASTLYKSIFLFIYSFHMPLFIFVSGLFHTNKNIKSKVINYLSIGFLLKIFYFLFEKCIIKTKIEFSLLSDKSISWFMFALAGYILLAYFFRDTNKKYILLMSILIALFAGYDESIGDYLYLSRIIVFFPFYLAGTMINKDKLIEINKNKLLKIISLILILIWLLICVFYIKKVYLLRPLFTGRNPYNVLELGSHKILYRILTYIITTIISFSIIMIIPNKNLWLITKYGQRTLQVYFWHVPIADFANNYCFNYFSSNALGKYLFLIFGIITTYILFLNIFDKPLKVIKENSKLIKNT